MVFESHRRVLCEVTDNGNRNRAVESLGVLEVNEGGRCQPVTWVDISHVPNRVTALALVDQRLPHWFDEHWVVQHLSVLDLSRTGRLPAAGVRLVTHRGHKHDIAAMRRW